MFPNCHDISSPSAHSHFFAAEVTILPGASLSRAHTRAKTSAAKIWLGGWERKRPYLPAGEREGLPDLGEHASLNKNGEDAAAGNAFPGSGTPFPANLGRKIGEGERGRYSG